jgi:hypothetical protein
VDIRAPSLPSWGRGLPASGGAEGNQRKGEGDKVAEEVSRTTGAYYDKEKKFLHATHFLLRPDETIVVASYSTGPIGRFVAKDVLYPHSGISDEGSTRRLTILRCSAILRSIII